MVSMMINKSKVYQVVNNIMIICFCLLTLSIVGRTQILQYNYIDLTLLQASNLKSYENQRLMPVFNYILQTHPQLQSYVIVSLTKDSSLSDNQTDYYIKVKNNDTNVIIAVSVSQDSPTFFVSYTKIDTHLQQKLNVSSSKSNLTNAPQATLQNPNKNSSTNYSSEEQPSNLLGGYRKLNNLEDDKFQKALKFLYKVHPNLINYQVIKVHYQVVSGVNFAILFWGVDRITTVLAKVNINLDGEAALMDFNVSCASTTASTTISCTSQKANKIYSGSELSIKTHPQLLDYRLVSIFIEDERNSTLIFMVTFQNNVLKLRAISQVELSEKGGKILSYYSYNYRYV